jgi:hypothetical protein
MDDEWKMHNCKLHYYSLPLPFYVCVWSHKILISLQFHFSRRLRNCANMEMERYNAQQMKTVRLRHGFWHRKCIIFDMMTKKVAVADGSMEWRVKMRRTVVAQLELKMGIRARNPTKWFLRAGAYDKWYLIWNLCRHLGLFCFSEMKLGLSLQLKFQIFHLTNFDTRFI